MKIQKIFGIDVRGGTAETVAARLETMGDAAAAQLLVTLNPEMLLAARADKKLKQVLQTAQVRVADGFGLALLTGGILAWGKRRVTGNDVIHLLMEQAEKRAWRVLLLGGASDQASRAAAVLQDAYPRAVVRADPAGVVAQGHERWRQEPDLLLRTRQFAPHVLFVALGHGKQEKWLADHLTQIPSAKIGVGVGGAFAFLCGDIRRAPDAWQRVGMEWLWRLLQEPRRFHRILRAIFLFPLIVFWDTMRPTRPL